MISNHILIDIFLGKVSFFDFKYDLFNYLLHLKPLNLDFS
jgi:hypothetical protein